MKRYIKLLLFFSIFCICDIVNAATIPVPKTGSFDCTYEIKYNDPSDNANRKVKVRFYGNSSEMYNVNHEFIEENICIVDGYPMQNCSDLSDLVNNYNPNMGDEQVVIQDAQLNVTDFVTTKGAPNWYCPTISYNVEYKSVNSVPAFYVKFGDSSLNYGNTTTAITNNCELGKGDIKNVFVCGYSLSSITFTGILENSKMRFYLEDMESSRDLEYTGGKCPDKSTLTLCLSETASTDFYVLYNSNSCDAGFKAITAKDLSNSESDEGGDVYDDENKNETTDDDGIDWDDPVDVNCDGIIGKELLDFINKIFRWIQIIAPIFVIIMGSVDFAGALLQDDRDALKKATNKFIKRLIIAVALFFIPIILSFILEVFNEIKGADSSICGIGGK